MFSILIPSPYVANNHQYLNALDLIREDAAYMIEEKDLDGDILFDKVDELINDDKTLNKMKDNLGKLAVIDSASIIYDNLKSLIK